MKKMYLILAGLVLPVAARAQTQSPGSTKDVSVFGACTDTDL